ncbi:MAG: sugar isomerase [bacterium]
MGQDSGGMRRRQFIGVVGASSALGALAVSASKANAAKVSRAGSRNRSVLPVGVPIRVKPVLVYQLPKRGEKTSWRGYGGLQTESAVNEEVKRIEGELKNLSSHAEFPLEFLPLVLVNNEQQAEEVSAGDCDGILVYASAGPDSWYSIIAASGIPNVMFLRHKSGPYYLYHEIAHWRFLRKSGDTIEEPNMDVDDIVVDDYDEVLWRLRALYGLKNAKGTKMLAIGSLAAYSKPAQDLGPTHAKEVWDYEIEILPSEKFAQRLQEARGDGKLMKEIERETDELLGQPNVTLETERRFVVNSLSAWKVCKEFLNETGATNFGFDRCMGKSVIEMLDTPPCLILALANDEGYTAYCHTDLSHTLPGVLMRWIAGKPTFVCNTHFPHNGMMTVAHCAAPMRMNGRDYGRTKIMTHFESDYGAATKVDHPKGQVLTVVVPNLHCTKWQGFRGKVIDSPSHPACRTQIDIEIDGDSRKLLTDMEGFHAQIVYGDYLNEIGYALKTLGGVGWENFSVVV